jgi:hypothetical protein
LYETITLLPQVAYRAPRRRAPTDDEQLTPGERRIWLAVREAFDKYGNPSLEEIALCCGRGKDFASDVHKYLRRLAKKGYVKLPPFRHPRSLQLLKTE